MKPGLCKVVIQGSGTVAVCLSDCWHFPKVEKLEKLKLRGFLVAFGRREAQSVKAQVCKAKNC